MSAVNYKYLGTCRTPDTSDPTREHGHGRPPGRHTTHTNTTGGTDEIELFLDLIAVILRKIITGHINQLIQYMQYSCLSKSGYI